MLFLFWHALLCVLSNFAIKLGEDERADCFALICFLMSLICGSSMRCHMFV